MKTKNRSLFKLITIIIILISLFYCGDAAAAETAYNGGQKTNHETYIFKNNLLQHISAHTLIIELVENATAEGNLHKPLMKLILKKSRYSSYNEWLYDTVNRSYFEIALDKANGIIKNFITAAGEALLISKTAIPGCDDACYDSHRIIYLSDTVQAEFIYEYENNSRLDEFQEIAAAFKLDGRRFSVDYPAGRYTIKAGNDANEELVDAAAAGDIKKINEALERGAKINARSDRADVALSAAAKNGRLKAIKYIVEKGGDVNVADSDGATALMTLATAGDIAAIKYLMKKGALIRTHFTKSAIEAAEQNGKTAAARYIKKAFVQRNLDLSSYKKFEYALAARKDGQGYEKTIFHILNGSGEHEECATEAHFFPPDILSMDIEIDRAEFKNYEQWLARLPVRGKTKKFNTKAGPAVIAQILIPDDQTGDYESEHIFFLNDKIQAVFSFMPQDSYLKEVFIKIATSFEIDNDAVRIKYPPEFEAATLNLFERKL